MTVQDIIALYNKWEAAKARFEDGEFLLDVENSKPDAAQYELLYKARIEAFQAFEKAVKDAPHDVRSAMHRYVMERRKIDARKAHHQAR